MDNNTKDETINWLKIKWIRVTKAKPNIIFYKTSFADEDFKELDIGIHFEKSSKAVMLRQKYQDVLPISSLKKNDLVKLCKERVIPSDYLSFYNSLKTVDSKPDFIYDSEYDTE